MSGGGGTLPGGGLYAALVSGGASTGGVMIGSGGSSVANSVQFSGLAAGSGHNCLQIDSSGYVTNTGAACGSGSGSGTVSSANAGQIAYYTSNGTALGGMSTVPLASGGTGSSNAAGAIQNLGGISLSQTSQQTMAGPLNANVNGVDSVTVFGAKGDCTGSGSTATCTDNHAAIQAAVDAAYASGASVYFPTNPSATNQTVYFTSQPINPKGVSMYGPVGSSGSSGYWPNAVPVAVRGAPGQDVFAVADATNSGYVAPHPSFTVRDLGILVDDSVDVSASFPARRPGRVAMDAAMSSSSAVLTSATAQFMPGDVGQAVTIAGAGASSATLGTTIASWQSSTQVTLGDSASTTVTGASLYVSVMGLPTTQNIGNCGFAYDDKNAAFSGLAPSKSQFLNVMIQTVSNNALNHTCGYFFQGNEAPYQTSWRDGFVEATFPFAFVPASGVAPSSSRWTGIADFDLFDHLWIAGHYSFIEYNGSYGRIQSTQISGALVGPHFMSSYGLETYASHWTIDIPEYEPDAAACTSGLVGLRVAGTDHMFQRLGMAFCSAGQSVQWDASEATARITLHNLSTFNITGSQNTFTVPYNADWLTVATINSTGLGNSLETGSSSNPLYGVQPARAQMVGGQSAPGTQAPDLARPALAFSRTHDFLNGNASTPYFNAEDLWLWPKEVGQQTGGVPTIVTDSASETGSSILNTSSASNYLNGSNDTGWAIGKQIPATRLRVYFKAKIVTAGNWWADLQANESGTWTSLGCNATFLLTTSYAVYSCDNDATGLAGDAFRIVLGGYGMPATNVSVAWIGLRPIPVDMPVASLQIAGGTTMTGNHGAGTSVQHSDGSGTSGACFFASDGSCTATAGALQNGTTATTQSVGDNSTKVATTAFVLANSGDSGGSFVPTGAIYSANNWANLGAFTNNGATATVIAAGTGACPAGTNSCIQFSGGAGNYTQTLDYTYNTQLPIWTISATYILGAPGSSTWGIGFGFRSNQSAGNYQPVSIRMDGSTGGTAGYVFLNSGPSETAVAESGAGLSLSGGDTIKVNLTRVYDTISGFVEDVTKGTIQNVSYQYTVASGTANLLPNIGRLSIFSIGGTQTVTSLKFTAGVPKGADVACIGDSKTVGYYATNYAGSWCSLLQGLGYRAYQLAGGYDTTADILSEVAEIQALAPKYAVLMIGGNDARNGVSSATYEANISSIVTNLTGAGITVYVATYPVENSGVNMSALNTWIANPAGCNCTYIDVNNGFSQTGSGVPTTWLASDSVHPAEVFHTYIAQTITGRLQNDAVKQQFPYYTTP